MKYFLTVFIFSIFNTAICLYHKLEENVPSGKLEEMENTIPESQVVNIPKLKRRSAEYSDESEMTQIDLASFLQPEEESENEETQYNAIDEDKDNSVDTLLSDEFKETKKMPDNLIESNDAEHFDDNINVPTSYYKEKVRRSNDKKASHESVHSKYPKTGGVAPVQNNNFVSPLDDKSKSSKGTKKFSFPFFFHEIDESVPGGLKNEPMIFCKWCKKEPAMKNGEVAGHARQKRSQRGLCRKCREALLSRESVSSDQVHNSRDYFKHMNRLASTTTEAFHISFNRHQKQQHNLVPLNSNSLLKIIADLEKKVDGVIIPGHPQ